MSKLILGVDPSTASTGWAIIESNQSGLLLVNYGAIKPSNRFKAHYKLKYIYDMLEDMYSKLDYSPDILGIEDQYFRFVNATKAVLRVRGVAELFAANHDMDLEVLHPTTLKKDFVGNGAATKTQVMDKVKDIYNIEVNTDDEADAIAIAHIVGTSLIAKGES